MQKREQIYISGHWVASGGDGSIDVINPSNEEVIGSVQAGTAVDVDAAVAAARAAFDGWAATLLEDRLALIEGLAGQPETGRAPDRNPATPQSRTPSSA